MKEVTEILRAIEAGNLQAADDLFPLIYAELRELAARRLANEPPGQTLQATALVHEVYLRLVEKKESRTWNSRGHFFAAAATAMRNLLVDNARRKQSLKHGGDRQRIALESADVGSTDVDEDILALDEALEELAAVDARAAELVSLRFFAGLTMKEAANALDVSLATAKRDWASTAMRFCPATGSNSTMLGFHRATRYTSAAVSRLRRRGRKRLASGQQSTTAVPRCQRIGQPSTRSLRRTDERCSSLDTWLMEEARFG